MILLAKVGIIGRNQAVEDVAYVLFSIFNVIWATAYLETWKRKGAELAYKWGTLDQRDDLLVEPRPLFVVSLYTFLPASYSTSVCSRVDTCHKK